MLIKVETYVCEFDKTPSEDDIKQALQLAKEHNCVIEIVWTLKWSGTYKRMFDSETTFEAAMNSLPKCYGL